MLCDLGASINLMPLSIFKKLGLQEAKPTTIALQMADRSIAKPWGVIEDVLVKVDKFIYPVDFVVLDMGDVNEVPLLLGRPFLATGRALIDVEAGCLTLRVDNEQVHFHKSHSAKPHEIKPRRKQEEIDEKAVSMSESEGRTLQKEPTKLGSMTRCLRLYLKRLKRRGKTPKTRVVPTAVPAADEIHNRKHQVAVELLGQPRDQNNE